MTDVDDDDIVETVRRLYEDEKMSIKRISEIVGRNTYQVQKFMFENNIETRPCTYMMLSKIQKETERKSARVIIDEELMETIDGTLLGDGHIRHEYSRFNISQIIPHEDFIVVIEEILTRHGISFNRNLTPKLNTKDILTIDTGTSEFLKQQRTRWYQEGKKHVPLDVRLTPRSLAYWYMGDGCLSNQKVPSLNPIHPFKCQLYIYTMSFPRNENEWLASKIKELYDIKFTVGNIRSNHTGTMYTLLTMADYNNINTFIKLVKPYITPSFQYKIPRINPNYKEAK